LFRAGVGCGGGCDDDLCSDLSGGCDDRGGRWFAVKDTATGKAAIGFWMKSIT